MTARIIQNEWAAHHIDLRIFSNFKFLDQSGYILFDVSLANSCCELFRIYWLTPKIIPSLWSVNSKLHIAQRCILPVYFPLDLLLLNILVNAQERKLAKRICVHWWHRNHQKFVIYEILFSQNVAHFIFLLDQKMSKLLQTVNSAIYNTL